MKRWKALHLQVLLVVVTVGVLAWFACISVESTSRAPGVSSLLDQIPEGESAGPWRVAAFCKERHPGRRERAMRGSPVDGEPIYSVLRRSGLDIPGGTTLFTRVAYPRGWGHGGVIELLIGNGDAVLARKRAALGSSWQEFTLSVPPAGADHIELRCRVPRDSSIPPIELAALAMDSTADVHDFRRARSLLAWAVGEPSDRALKGLTWKRFHLTEDTNSVEIFAAAAGDTVSFDVPKRFRGGTLEFEVICLRGHSAGDGVLHVDVRQHGQWETSGRLGLGEFQGDRTRSRFALNPQGDGLRFRLSGTHELVGIGIPLVRPREASGPATNLVVIDLDTMRADRLGCYGYALRPTSERLDSLLEAKGFIVFTSAYSAGPWTISATPKFLASRFMNIHHGDAVPRGNLMLAEMLRNEGYYCAAFTGGAVLQCPGFDQGFHEYYAPKGIGKVEDVFPPARDWIHQNSNRPFFLFIHTYENHMPYTRDVFCRDLPRGRLGDLTLGEPLLAELTGEFDGTKGRVEVTAEESLYVEAAYDGGVRTATEATAEFLSEFDLLGLWRNSIIVILSDHGEEFWEHTGAFAFHSELSIYNELLRVPFIVRVPGAQEGTIRFVDETVSTVDLVPTVLELLELPAPGPLDGASLAPLLWGEGLKRALPVWATNDPLESSPRMCVFAEGLKYITADCTECLGELYDLERDSDERRNLSTERPETHQRLADLLASARQSASLPTADEESSYALPDELKARLRKLGYVQFH